MLCRLITADSSDGGGSAGNSGARRSNSRAYNSRNTDTVGNNRTDSNSRMGNSHNSQEIRFLFRPRRQRQNAVRERKPATLPPIRSKEVFSSSCFSSLKIKQD